jgi:hypothetical protein
MKNLIITVFLIFTSLLGFSQSTLTWLRVQQIYSKNADYTEFLYPIKIGSYYLKADSKSVWLEKPLGTFIQRLDSIVNSGGSSSQWTTTSNGINYAGAIFPGSIKKWDAVADTFITIKRLTSGKFGYYIYNNSGSQNIITTNNSSGAQNFIMTNAGTQGYIDVNNGHQHVILTNNLVQNSITTNSNGGYQNYITNNGSTAYQNYILTNNGTGYRIIQQNGIGLNFTGTGRHIIFTSTGSDTTEVINQTSTGINKVYKKNGVITHVVENDGSINLFGTARFKLNGVELSTGGSSQWTTTTNGITYSGAIFPGSIKKWDAVTDTFISIPTLSAGKYGFYIKNNASSQNIITTNTGYQNFINTNNSGYQNYISTNDGEQNAIYTNTGRQNAISTNSGRQNYITTNSGYGNYITTNNGYQNYIYTNSYSYQNYIATNNSTAYQNYIITNNGIAYQIDTQSGTGLKFTGTGKHIRFTSTGSDTTVVINQTSSGLNTVLKLNGVTVQKISGDGSIDIIGSGSFKHNGVDITAGGGSMVYPGAGIPTSTGSAWGTSITDNSVNWNTAYSWGNHSGLYRPISYVPAWSEITSKPTTISGYGITDAIVNPITTAGDIIIGGTSGAATRLAATTNGYVLTLVSGSPAWTAASGTGNMNTSTYDAAGIAQQVVGTTATQALTNKTLTSPALTTPTVTTSIIGGATFAAFNTTTTNLSLGGAATTMTIGGTPTTAITHTYSGNATASGVTKTVNVGTGGASGSTTNVNIGSANGGTTTINSPTLAVGTGSITMTGSIAATSNRVTKGWFTNLEITNTPTINGTAMSSIYTAIADTVNTTRNGTMSISDYNKLMFLYPSSITYTTAIPFTKAMTDIEDHTMTAAVTFTVNSTNAVDNAGAQIKLVNSSSYAIDLTAFHVVGTYDNTKAYSILTFERKRGMYIVSIINFN